MLRCIQGNAEDDEYEGGISFETTDAFHDVCSYLKAVLLHEDQEGMEKIRVYFGKEETIFEELLEYVKGKMQAYYQMAPIRKMEITAPDKVQGTLGKILDNFVFRYYPKFFIKHYDELGFEDVTDMLDVAFTLENLTTYVVKANYTKEAMQEALASLTYLTEQTCAYLAGRIDQNFEQMKLTIIMKQLDEN